MRKLLYVVSRVLLLAAIVVGVLGVEKAFAATWELSWVTNATETGVTTEVERSPVSANRCGQFGRVATVPLNQSTYVDLTAPDGFFCYRVRNVISIDPADGAPVIQKASGYSNVDSTKPGNPKNLLVK